MQGVYNKVANAKKEMERKKHIGDEVEDEMYNWITRVEQNHMDHLLERESLRIIQASPSSDVSHDLMHNINVNKSLKDLVMTHAVHETEFSPSGQPQQGLEFRACMIENERKRYEKGNRGNNGEVATDT